MKSVRSYRLLLAYCFLFGWLAFTGLCRAQVSAPVFNPAPMGFGSMTYVTISDTGASSIYYTVDGSTPTTSSNLYAAPVLAGRNLVLKAIGYNGGNASAVTSGTYDVMGAIGVGDSYVLALKFNDTVYGWGANASGQLGNGATATAQDSAVLMGGTNTFNNVAAIDGGYNASIMLKWDGTVWTCGGNSEGELGNGTTTTESFPVQVQLSGSTYLTGIGAVSGGAEFSVAVSATAGTVYSWGINSGGQCAQGQTTTTDYTRAVEVRTSNTGPTYLGPATSGSIVQVTGGSSWAAALSAAGTVWTWGSNADGQQALPASTTLNNLATKVSGLPSIMAIGGAGYSVFAITGSSTVLAWGYNTGGQLALGNTTSPIRTPTQALAGAGIPLTNIAQISSSTSHTLFLTGSGTVFASGSNNYGELGNGITTQKTYPVQVMLSGSTPLTNIIEVGAGDNFSVALSSNGTIYTWGYNGYGNLCNGTTTSGSSGYYATTSGTLPGLLDVPPYISSFTASITTNAPATVTLSAAATVASNDLTSLSLYDGGGALLTSTSASTVTWSIPSVMSGTYGYTAVAEDEVGNVGEAATQVTVPLPTVAIEAGASPLTEGQASYFELFRTGSDSVTAPITVNFNIGGTAVEGVRYQTLPTSATIGSGSYNVQVPLITNTDNILEGVQSVIITGTAGQYNFTTGYNSAEIDIQDPQGPAVTITPDGYSAVSSTSSVVVSCTNSAAVIHYTWGGGQPTVNSPVIVSGSSLRPLSSGTLTVGAWIPGATVVTNTATFIFTGAVTGGVAYSLAIRSDGTVWAWGLNTSGQLGDGTTIDRYSPVQVLTSATSVLSNIVQVTAGNTVSMALDSTDHIYTWGGTASNPYATPTGSGATAIAVSDHDQIVSSISPQPVYIACGYTAAGSGTANQLYQLSTVPYYSGNGYLWGLGTNDQGQLAVNQYTSGYHPVTPVSTWTEGQEFVGGGPGPNIPAGPVATCETHTASIVNGQIYAWGALGGSSPQIWATAVSTGTGSVALATGTGDFLVLRNNGKVVQSTLGGYNGPVFGSSLLTGTAVAIGDGSAHSLAILSDGSVWTWGSDSTGQLGIGVAGVNETIPVRVLGFYLNYWDDPNGIGMPTWQARQLGLNPYVSNANPNSYSDGNQWAWGILNENYYNNGTSNTVVTNGNSPFSPLPQPQLPSNPSETSPPTIYVLQPVGGTLY